MKQATAAFDLPGPEHTRRLGALLGSTASEGATLALDGELGAGKTTLTQGLGAALGVEGPVTSPTFQLLFVHEGRLRLFHADLYRLGDASELTELGFDEVLGTSGVSVIEWAGRFPDVLPGDYLQLTLTYEGDGRCAHAEARGACSSGWLERTQAGWDR
ncbi:MAG TPA: tRNA (adenosine(37)-N6)-threonylcarbamoyltransferase complex ATPase subunit type 1 TsaE [Myxococcota bacterium]|nr:tRNA (adenosine(37)-N6)-threonylcarbamoyltransferase complex ATPase subunit type 1 TsaE [Myxococcota bacterium]